MMKSLFVVTKNELIRYFVSPLAYVYLLSFIVLNASFAIYFGDFFNHGQADLLSMFVFQPWLYLLFIPGISMRLWAEEFHSKTIIQIITQPVKVSSLVIGKFFAAWIFCGIALLLTFPFWITVNILGIPDNNVILMGYCGSFIIAGCMLAISQTMSALTKNQIIALVLAVIANLFFFWSGIEYILSFCRLFLPDTLVDVVASFSFITHFNTISNGLFELRDVIFFASLIIFANYTTILIINFKTAGTSGWLKSTNKGYTLVAWLMLLLGFFGLNILANTYTTHLQYDGTQEKNYTLTESTVNVLNNLQEPVIAKLYFSPVLEQRNSIIREQFDRVRLLLKQYKNISKGKFDYKIYYPKFLSTEEDIALADGVQPIPLIDLNQTALFGMTIENTLQDKDVIPFFAQTHYGALEQDITALIYNLGRNKKTLAIVSGLPIFGDNSEDSAILNEPWEIVKTLQKNYNLLQFKNAENFKEHKFDVLLLFAPQHLSADMIAEIKNYSRSGGKIMLILDPATEASRLYGAAARILGATDIGELEEFWGIRFFKDYVVADLKNSITVDATIDYSKNPVFSQDVIQFKLTHDDMNPQHPVTKNLHEIMLASAAIIMPDPQAYSNKDITFYPLLRASNISALMTAKVVSDGLNPQDVLKYFTPDDNQKFLAAEVIGMSKENPFDLIVIGDSDFLYDSFWMQKTTLLTSEYVYGVFDNANFVLNALDYLTGNDALLSLRGKRLLNRRFNDIETMRRINSLQYKKQEEEIFAQVDKAKQALSEVWNKKEFEERENFNADELAAIAQVRNNLNRLRIQLSELRYQAFKDIKIIASRVAFFNIWLIPLILVTLILVYGLLKMVRRKTWPVLSFSFNKPLLILSGICLMILILGLLSVYKTSFSRIDSYENKLVFPDLLAQINDIDEIELKTNNNEIVFVKNSDEWKIKQQPEVPVYQSRIRRLLSILADARYFARKSSLAEHLSMFNLLPLDDKKSQATLITLKNQNKEIIQFYLGDINIDIGRGSRAAYIRFPKQFQVWEISADFIDMDLDWHKWTYSNLWDLRYGRVYDKNNDPQNEQALLYITKLMLNTPFIAVTEKPIGQPVKQLNLYVEGGDYVKLIFYSENGKAYVAYEFDKNNVNKHLKILAKYLSGKTVEIDKEKMEKIVEIIE